MNSSLFLFVPIIKKKIENPSSRTSSLKLNLKLSKILTSFGNPLFLSPSFLVLHNLTKSYYYFGGRLSLVQEVWSNQGTEYLGMGAKLYLISAHIHSIFSHICLQGGICLEILFVISLRVLLLSFFLLSRRFYHYI